MSKIAVVYWSGTGNTEAMAKRAGRCERSRSGRRTSELWRI